MLLTHRFLSPTLAALVAGCLGLHAGEEATRARDAQFQAVRQVVDLELRLVAERQLKDYLAQSYPDETGWYAKALRWMVADRFRANPIKAVADAYVKEADTLFPELDAARKANKLPPAVAQILASTNATTRLISVICGTNGLIPNAPLPLAGTVTKERLEQITNALNQLVKSAGENLDTALAAYNKYFKEVEEPAMDKLEPETPEFVKINQASILMRNEIVRQLVQAHIALREVVTRGREFGIDPAPAEKFLAGTLKQHLKIFDMWDFQAGEQYPYLKGYVAVLRAEGARWKLPDTGADRVVEGFGELFKIQMKDVPEQGRAHLKHFQLEMWANLFRWANEMKNDKVTALVAQQWDGAFKTYYNNDKSVHPEGPDEKLAQVTAEVYIQAALLFNLKGDTVQANALLSKVGGAAKNRYAPNAKAWTKAIMIGGGGGGSSWSDIPVAADPRDALSTGRIYYSSARQSIDPFEQRRFYMNAAVILRNGILGLSEADQQTMIEVGPDLYQILAVCLSKAELPYHAAVIAAEGLSAVAARGGKANEKANPWRGKDLKFTTAGASVERLARTAAGLGQSLNSRAKNAAGQRLRSDVIALVNQIAPTEVGGPSFELSEVAQMIEDKRFEEALRMLGEFIKKYPAEKARAFGMFVSASRQWYDSLEKNANSDPKRAEIIKNLVARADDEINEVGAKTDKDSLKRLTIAKSAKAFALIKAGKFIDVIDALIAPQAWIPMPEDSVAAGQVQDLARAVYEFYQASVRAPEDRSKPKLLSDNWPRYLAAYEAFAKAGAKLPGESDRVQRSGKNLAVVFQSIAKQADAFQAVGGADAPRFTEISRKARAAMADLLAPTLTPKSDQNMIRLVADTLWDIEMHAKSRPLYEILRANLASNGAANSFRANPKPELDRLGALFTQRPELKVLWEALRDLLEDKQPIKQWWENGRPLSEFGEKPIDYLAAYPQVLALRKAIDAIRDKIGAELHKQFSDQAEALAKVAETLAQDIRTKERLAECYRESGASPKAQALFSELFDYDPYNREYSSAYVELVIDALKNPSEGKPVPNKDSLAKARSIAVDNRDILREGSEKWWIAVTQVLELCVAMGELEPVNRRLDFIAINKSDISRDLIAPSLDLGGVRDDPRARWPRNAATVTLCERFLQLYLVSGVTAKPTFRIDKLTVDGATKPVFIDANAPNFEAISVENRDGETVQILWEVGKTAPKAAPAENKAAAETSKDATGAAPTATTPSVAPAPGDAKNAATTPTAPTAPTAPKVKP